MKKTFAGRLAVALVALCFMGSASAGAQDFLERYDTLKVNEIDNFFAEWKMWSDGLLRSNKFGALDDLTIQVYRGMAKESAYIASNQSAAAFTVLSTKILVKHHFDGYDKRKPGSTAFAADEDKEAREGILPVVAGVKPALFLTEGIAARLINYLSNDYDGSRMGMLMAYIPVVKDAGGYHFCSLPYISSYDVFPDAVVVKVRDSWSTGRWMLYKPDELTFVKKKNLGSWKQ